MIPLDTEKLQLLLAALKKYVPKAGEERMLVEMIAEVEDGLCEVSASTK